MSAKVKKFIVGALMITSICGIITGCGSTDNITDNNVVQATTPEATTPVATTTEEQTTEYVYKGEQFLCEKAFIEYFDGLVMDSKDKIYLNEVCTDEFENDDAVRGNLALCLFGGFKMYDEQNLFEEKYLKNGAYVPEVPYSDNYFIEYTGEKIQFLYVKSGEVWAYFDVITIE